MNTTYIIIFYTLLAAILLAGFLTGYYIGKHQRNRRNVLPPNENE